jgi:tetratricopeptide (TPR) repeat protein
MDMLVGFTRGQVTDFKEIYLLLRRLEQLISDNTGTTFINYELEDQDYYVPRSTIVGEAVLSRAEPAALKSVIKRFYENVSPYRIPEYDSFKRSAFDNDLMVRAFVDVDEGLAFYEEQFPVERLPYILQQAALYASKKRHFQEAFDLIDRALTISGSAIWSIRNSWAVIIFSANISHFDDPLGRRTLNDSMDMLQKCYESDRRKPYHAVTYARQALRLWQECQAEEAIEYLHVSLSWLREENKKSPWNWQIKDIQQKIQEVVPTLPKTHSQ